MSRPTLLFLVFMMTAAFEPGAGRQTQADMNETARVEYTTADTELNRVYQQILQAHKADLEFVLKFKAAQHAWLVFRDAHLVAMYPAADKRRAYGTVYPVCRWQVLTELTQARTKQLKAWTEPPEEGDTCAGSRTP